MSEEAATVEYSDDAKKLGDEIAGMTLKQAKELSDYLENEHGIKAAAGGGVMVAAAGGGGGEEAAEAQTEFDVILTGFGDKKLDVVKIVKTITGASLTAFTANVTSAALEFTVPSFTLTEIIRLLLLGLSLLVF